jgi:hypothetical protein
MIPAIPFGVHGAPHLRFHANSKGDDLHAS